MEVSKVWEVYAEKFNLLTDLMMEAGIDPKLLIDVIKAATDLQKCT